MFRREWPQQILVLALLTVAVAAAIGSVTIAYNSGAADNAEFGSANHLLRFDGTDPRKLQAALDSAKDWFGTTDFIGHRSVTVPGGFERVEFRAQNPRGAYGGALLALRQGSYPVGPDQVAVTDGVAELLSLEIGETLALDGHRRTVVGIVEDPRDLRDEFALLSPSSAGAPDHVTVLVDADAESLRTFRQSLADGAEDGRSAYVGSEARPSNQAASALAMFSVATVFLLLASLVAAAGFAVIAQRRLRQLGMLAAIGATGKHLRLVLLTNGAVVGAIGALLGTIVGLTLWLAIVPTLERAVNHRIDRLSLPWTLLAIVVLVAVLGATAAAWWPGRAVARVPVTLALSARPPRPKPAHHSAIVAAVLIAAGIGGLALANRSSPPFIIAGILATIIGTLLLGPAAIRVVARAAGRAPIAVRLALRDLARSQARSGAALAAIDPSTDFLADPTVRSDELVIVGGKPRTIPGTQKRTIAESAVTNVQRIDSRELLGSPNGDTGVAPSSFVTPNGLRRRGWKTIPSGWLLESSRPLTSEQVAAARDLAANAGLTIEARRESTSFAKPIAIASAAGALLALAILAMTVGLIRSESAGDLRTLTATGATSRIRRTLTA